MKLQHILAAMVSLGLTACVSDLAGKSSTPTPPSGNPTLGDGSCADKPTQASLVKTDNGCPNSR